MSVDLVWIAEMMSKMDNVALFNMILENPNFCNPSRSCDDAELFDILKAELKLRLKDWFGQN